jgi:hypothetical protein
MPQETSITHRLYLKQFSLLKKGNSDELLPLNFNYQDIVIVTTGLLENGGKRGSTRPMAMTATPSPP